MKKLKIALLVIGLFVLGFLREFLFESINTHLYYLWREQSNPYLPKSLSFLAYFDYWSLYYTKFMLILVFTVIYFFGSILVVKQYFSERIFTRFTFLFFAGIFILSALIFGLGYVFGAGHEAYGISRKLIEFIQSPLACFFLIPAFLLYRNEKLRQ